MDPSNIIPADFTIAGCPVTIVTGEEAHKVIEWFEQYGEPNFEHSIYYMDNHSNHQRLFKCQFEDV